MMHSLGMGVSNFALQQSALSNKNHQDGGRAHYELARVPRGEFFIRLRFVDSPGDQLLQLYSSCTRRLAFWWSSFPSIDLPQLPNLRACTACATKRGGILAQQYIITRALLGNRRPVLHPCITLEQSAVDTYICLDARARTCHHTCTSCVYATRPQGSVSVFGSIHRINSELLIALNSFGSNMFS